MKAFLDSSAFAKRFIEEDGSDRVEALCAKASELGLSVICVPEVVSALCRRKREHELNTAQFQAAKRRLVEDVEDAVIIQLTPEVVISAIHILQASPVRAMDALHVACALNWGAEVFASADDRQLQAAKKAGLRTKRI